MNEGAAPQNAVFRYSVPPDRDGAQVHDLLRRAMGLSYSTVVRLRHAPGALRCNGVPVRTVDRVRAGDELTAALPEPAVKPVLPYTGGAAVPAAYEDDTVIVYDKPAGMPVHQAKWHQSDTLANVFAADMAARGLSLPFRAVNRLDRDTSGLCVVAKNAHAAYFLTNSLEKEYTAAVSGCPQPLCGAIDLPIARVDEVDILRRVDPTGQRAVTHYRVVEQSPDAALVKVRLETGRTHQIRVHFSHVGHPLLGDERYGGPTNRLSRQALHCSRVWFSEPGGRRVTVVSVPPFWQDWRPPCRTDR